MKRKRVIVNKNSKVRRQRDPIPWKYCVLTVICGLLLVSGFFIAAKQHFTAVDVAMDNADLRKKLSNLKHQNRLLTLKKERALRPERIAKLAKSIGFTAVPRVVYAGLNNPQRTSAETREEKPVYSYAHDLAKEKVKKTVPAESKTNAKQIASKPDSRNPADELFIQNQIAALSAQETTAELRE